LLVFASFCPIDCFLVEFNDVPMTVINQIFHEEGLNLSDLVVLLQMQGEQKQELFAHATKIKKEYRGNKVFFRGLIELSNHCSKDCFYCGIRHSNQLVKRYFLNNKQVLEAARFAYENRYGSVVIQAGELNTKTYIRKITKLIEGIKKLSDGKLGITLSLGEQSEETYREWFKAGAHRYLLRIETSNEELYKKLHPSNHLFSERLECLEVLRKTGYQVGTGVMIGLPFQTLDDLAADLLFMKKSDIDMVGMGPYIEHAHTPLYSFRESLWPMQQRFDLTLKMIAILRIMMKDINIAATTALQAIDPLGREKAVKIGANIIMPNITPGLYRNDYALYPNKPCVDEEPGQCKGCLDARLALADSEIGYDEWGDSLHFLKRKNQR